MPPHPMTPTRIRSLAPSPRELLKSMLPAASALVNDLLFVEFIDGTYITAPN
jgi:hypothetical protein